MTRLHIKVTFKDYEFRRAKATPNGALAHTTQDWIGKQVIVMPMPMTVTDRLIESNYDETAEEYTMTFKDTPILNKQVKASTTTGRIYLPKEYIGLDVLILEEPHYNHI